MRARILGASSFAVPISAVEGEQLGLRPAFEKRLTVLRRFRTVALALTVAMGALYVLPTTSSATSSARLGSRLVHRFYNELVRRDVARLRAFLSPAFQIQRADGSRDTKAHYLRHLPDVLSYRVQKLVETTASGVVVVTYLTSTTQLVNGQHVHSGFAPRISAFVHGARGWQMVSQGDV